MGNGIFTRNFDNMMTACRLGGCKSESSTLWTGGKAFADGDLTLKATDGSLKTSYSARSNGSSGIRNLPFTSFGNDINTVFSSYYTYLYLGSNNTEETYDDTAILSPLSVGMQTISQYDLIYTKSEEVITQAPIYNAETKCFEQTFSKTFIVNRDCTLGEFGFYCTPCFLEVSGQFCVYRQAFETPFNFKAGDQFKFTFKFSVPANPSKPISIEANIK